MLPESTVLGELEIIEVYEFYIQPALFACMNRTKQVYLAVWIDDNEQSSRWLYVALSHNRYSDVRRGDVSLRRAFSEPEDGVVLDVVVPNDPELMPQVGAIPADQIEEAWLPAPGEYLDIDTPMPDALRAEARAGRFQYSGRLSSRSFRIQVNTFRRRGPEPRFYSGLARPLDRESYERLRRRIEGPREDEVDMWLETHDLRSSKPALVA